MTPRALFPLSSAVALLAACGVDGGSTRTPAEPCAGLFAEPRQLVAVEPAYPDLPPFMAEGRETPLAPMALRRDPMAPEDAWIAALRQGVVVRFRDDPGVDAYETLLDIRDRVDFFTDDGLLSLEPAPDFVESGLLYLLYVTREPRHVRVSAFAERPDGLGFDASSERVLFEAPKIPETNSHSGGSLHVGPDGMLYGAIGDGGFTRPPSSNAQDLDSLLGTVFRVDVRGATDEAPYAIPPENPFAPGGPGAGRGRPEIWAWGLRNPFRFSFDPANGDLWLGDVGQGTWEEVDLVVGGADYGWPILEGPDCFPPGEVTTCDDAGRTPPAHAYRTGEGQAIVGGVIYRGTAIPELRGDYLFADFATGTLHALRDPRGRREAVQIASLPFGPVGFGVDADGEIVLVGLREGQWLRVVPARGGDAAPVPTRLAETGCMAPGDPTRLHDAFTPYDVRVPLWSDGAAKSRALAMPAEGLIDVDDRGDLVFPVGSVLAKDFTRDGRRLETRFLVRRGSGDWAGYSYRWNAAGTEAALVTEPTEAVVGDATWHFPSPDQCGRCHTAAAGHTLGPESAQLESPAAGGQYPLDAWADAGWLVPEATWSDTRLPAPDDETVPVGVRARAYLHANCASCHQPGHALRAEIDLRYDTPLAASGLCEAPRIDDLGLPDPRIVAPGAAGRSVLLARMATRGPLQMPPLASARVDPVGTTLVTAWIDGLDTCP